MELNKYKNLIKITHKSLNKKKDKMLVVLVMGVNTSPLTFTMIHGWPQWSKWFSAFLLERGVHGLLETHVVILFSCFKAFYNTLGKIS